METNTIRIKEDETNQELFKEIEEFFSIGGLNTPIDLITSLFNFQFKVAIESRNAKTLEDITAFSAVNMESIQSQSYDLKTLIDFLVKLYELDSFKQQLKQLKN